MDLESKVVELNKEVSEGGSNKKTRSASDWIPRPPEKYETTPTSTIFQLMPLCPIGLSYPVTGVQLHVLYFTLTTGIHVLHVYNTS